MFIHLVQHTPSSLEGSRTLSGPKDVCTLVEDTGTTEEEGSLWERRMPPEESKRFPPRLSASWKQLENQRSHRLGQKGDICSCRLWRNQSRRKSVFCWQEHSACAQARPGPEKNGQWEQGQQGCLLLLGGTDLVPRSPQTLTLPSPEPCLVGSYP